MPTLRTLTALSLTLAVGGCSLPPVSTWHSAARGDGAGTPERDGRPYVEVGTASWYGPGFHGNRTSSGVVYDQNELTAAHQTLPIGTRLVVTNLENGKAVEVTVNDRGPFLKGRIIDLSFASARAVGIVRPGTARVRLEAIGDGVVKPIAYAVQAGAFRDGAHAGLLQTALASTYQDVYTSPLETPETVYYRVRLGPYDRREEAAIRAKELVRTGVPALIVEEARP